ncbi:hypothetical protein [Methanosphaera sp.]
MADLLTDETIQAYTDSIKGIRKTYKQIHNYLKQFQDYFNQAKYKNTEESIIQCYTDYVQSCQKAYNPKGCRVRYMAVFKFLKYIGIKDVPDMGVNHGLKKHKYDSRNNKVFTQFARERNIQKGTKNCYISALDVYCEYHDMSLDELLAEAREDEEKGLILKKRRLKDRLISFRNHILDTGMSGNTIHTYFSKVQTVYRHYEIEIPQIPQIKLKKSYITTYRDIPTRKHIKQALGKCNIGFKAFILFQCSSGSARAEALSLTVRHFISGCEDYLTKNTLDEQLQELSEKTDIVPTIYLRRIKTDKQYFTFCTPEASHAIIDYLLSRDGLTYDSKLFEFTNSSVTAKYQKINDNMGWGYKGNYRFFRSHALRKFHASNIGLPAEYIDSLQGRSKGKVHEAYIKVDPSQLKEKYVEVMKNVTIDYDPKEEFESEKVSELKHEMSQIRQITGLEPIKEPINIKAIQNREAIPQTQMTQSVQHSNGIYKKIQNRKTILHHKNSVGKLLEKPLENIEKEMLKLFQEENISNHFNFTKEEAILTLYDLDDGSNIEYKLNLPLVNNINPMMALQEQVQLQKESMKYLYLQVFEIL